MYSDFPHSRPQTLIRFRQHWVRRGRLKLSDAFKLKDLHRYAKVKQTAAARFGDFPFDGLLGLGLEDGSGQASALSQLAQGWPQPVFSFALRDSGPAEITVGAMPDGTGDVFWSRRALALKATISVSRYRTHGNCGSKICC